MTFLGNRKEHSLHTHSDEETARRWREQKRILLLAALGSAWLLLVAVRLWDLQVRQAERFIERAARQQESLIEVQAQRGAIVDRRGEKLALSTPSESIGVFPGKVRDPEMTAALLAPMLNLEPRELLDKFRRDRFQWLKRLTEPGEAERVRNLNLQCLHFEKESKRYYPKNSVAAHILGAVGIDPVGLAGVEQYFDEVLQGRPGKKLVHYDALRQDYASVTVLDPEPGANLVLTIDQRLQTIVEQELQKAIFETRSRAGSIVVMDPWEGDILALANWPTFDPNKREIDRRELRLRHNYAVSHLIEPGSTFKLVTVAAALDQKLTAPDEWIDCQMGFIYLGKRRIRDHKRFEVLSVADVVARSSNVGAIKLALRLEAERMHEYARRFGFGTTTGIALPGEIDGLLREPAQWQSASIGSIAIGQEIGVTALQMARATAVIANGGLLIRPRIVEAIVHPDGRRQRREPPAPARAIREQTAATMRALMERVVQGGTGRLAQTPGYRVGGKTGTAQMIDPETRAYSPDNYVASFVGLAPVNNPALVAVIVLEAPQGQYYGGQVAAPVFPRIAVPALRLLDVVPDRPLDSDRLEPPPAPEQMLADFVDEPDRIMAPAGGLDSQGGLREDEILVASFANSPSPAPPPEADAAAGNAAALPRNPVALRVTGLLMPDFRGQTVRQVLARSSSLNLRVELKGEGVVVRQWPVAGSPVATGSRVRVELGGRPRRQESSE